MDLTAHETCLVQAQVAKAIAAEWSLGSMEYSFNDLEVVSVARIRWDAQEAAIIRAGVRESGVAEAQRADLLVDTYVGKGGVRAISDGIPSKGSWDAKYDVYDYGRSHLLVIREGALSGLGGSIAVMAWDPSTADLRLLFECSGDEFCGNTGHGFGLDGYGRYRLIIHGPLAEKDWSSDIASLEKALGVQVEFHP